MIENSNLARRFELNDVELSIDTRIFPLPIIDRVISAFGEQVADLEIEESSKDEVKIKLSFISNELNAEEIVDLFHAKLISANAMVNSLEKNKEIRNYFSRSAFNVTLDARKVVLEQNPTKKLGKGVVITIDEDEKIANVSIDTKVYSLPQVLLAANEMRDVCHCSVDARDYSKIIVEIKSKKEEYSLFSICKSLYERLEMTGL